MPLIIEASTKKRNTSYGKKKLIDNTLNADHERILIILQGCFSPVNFANYFICSKALFKLRNDNC